MSTFNPLLLSDDVQEFIRKNLNTDIYKLISKKSPFLGVSSSELAVQISSKNKCKNKLPLWFQTPKIYFPPTISVEQSSSEQTAIYKSSLLENCHSVVDMTGGFGVDSYYLAKKCQNVIHCEIQNHLSEIAKHNFSVLNQKNINCFLGSSFEYFVKNPSKVDTIYIDPARRNEQKQKVFLLSDCQPNVPEILPNLWNFTSKILLKVSPILDIQSAINELDFVSEIHIVSVNNEVKELLFLLNKEENNNKIQTISVNISQKNIQKSKFFWEEKKEKTSSISSVKNFLYEPNSSLMKSGAWGVISEKYGVEKLHNNTHLFSSETFIADFPGRIFQVKDITSFSKNSYKKTQANISTRNFPLSVDEIRKKLKIRDGGNIYLFFTTNSENKKIIIECQKISVAN